MKKLQGMTRTRPIHWSMVAFAVLLFCTSNLWAEETQTFCITGQSDGVGWRIDLAAPSVAVGLPLSINAGASATSMASASVARINLGDGGPFSAEFVCTGEDGAGYFDITGPGGFTFSVAEVNGKNPCQVTGNSAGCSFNPEIVDIATIEHFDLVCSVIKVPTLPGWGLVGLVVLTAIGGAIIVGRRRVSATHGA